MRLFAGLGVRRGRRGPVAGAETIAGRGRPPPKLMTATVLFSDIRGFSTISTTLPEAAPRQLARRSTWSRWSTSCRRTAGVIEKFAGDGLTVAFGVPEPRETDAEIAADAQAAVDCALAMADSLRRASTARWRSATCRRSRSASASTAAR